MKFTEHMAEIIRLRREENVGREIMAYTGKLEGRELAARLGVDVPELWSRHGPSWCEAPPWEACVVKPTSSSNGRGVLPLERGEGLWRSLFGDGGPRSWRGWWLWSAQEHERHRYEGIDPYRQEWIVEELVRRKAPNGALLLPYDFKCYAIGGRVAWVNQIDKTSSRDARSYRTRHWWRTSELGLLPARKAIIHQHRRYAHLPGPRWERELLDAADRIARALLEETGSPFVRVDLFEHDDGRIIFGEITPHPSGGREVYDEEADRILGQLWSRVT